MRTGRSNADGKAVEYTWVVSEAGLDNPRGGAAVTDASGVSRATAVRRLDELWTSSGDPAQAVADAVSEDAFESTDENER